MLINFRCDQCAYKCNYRENLARHKKTHLSAEERQSFVCHICNFETFYRKSYQVHMKMIHSSIDNDGDDCQQFKCYHCMFETRYR